MAAYEQKNLHATVLTEPKWHAKFVAAAKAAGYARARVERKMPDSSYATFILELKQ